MRAQALELLAKIAKDNKEVVFLGSDLGAGTMNALRDEAPERFFMEGINEQNLIGKALGLAQEGFTVYVCTISAFLIKRAYEQLALGLKDRTLKIRLLGLGGGFVYAPLGPSHLSLEDISLMRNISSVTSICPCDEHQMTAVINQSVTFPGPLYIRFGKGNEKSCSAKVPFEIGKPGLICSGEDLLILSTGVLTQPTLEVVDSLKISNIQAAHLNVHSISDELDSELLVHLRKFSRVVTIEEHYLRGGLGSWVSDLIQEYELQSTLLKCGVCPKELKKNYGNQHQHLEAHGLTKDRLVERISRWIKH